MNTKLIAITIILLCSSIIIGQNIDSLKLTEKEIPENYKLSSRNNCISIQACTFYENPEIYDMLIGTLKSKKIQNFDGKKDKGSIMYFEFEKDFQATVFLGSLLWGGDKPTKAHPEEFYAKGNILIIWSFKRDSPILQISKDKIKKILK